MSVKRLAPLGHVTAADAATTALFNAIVEGTIEPGTHLRLNELAEQFELSMMPVREALRRLEHLGLVEHERNRGAFVRGMTLDDVMATYEIRFLLEGEASYLAAQHFPAASARVAREALKARAYHLERGDTQLARDAHEHFHFAIYEASDNPWLVRSITPLWRNAERYRLESMRRPELHAQRAHEHEAMLETTIAGDAEGARDRTVEHLRASLDVITDKFRAARDEDPTTST